MDFEIPDLPQAIVGYRSWLMREGVLVSPTGQPWREGRPAWPRGRPLKAECFSEEHPPCAADRCSSDVGQGCGIYAYDSLENLQYAHNPGLVFGEVWLWGRVVEYTKGYRAQFAQPKILYIWGSNPEQHANIELAAANYGVETRWSDEIHDMSRPDLDTATQRHRLIRRVENAYRGRGPRRLQ